MPTVMTVDGLQIVIYPNDHLPAHVHVRAGSGRARFALNCPEGPVRLWNARHIRRADLEKARLVMGETLNELCAKWKDLHG